jgi:hypothetical protein
MSRTAMLHRGSYFPIPPIHQLPYYSVLQQNIYLFLRNGNHSLNILPYDRSTVTSTASYPRVRSTASSFNFHYSLSSLKLSSSFLRLLPRLPVTSILPSIFPSISCFRRQFLCKMWPIQLAFLLFTVCRIFLSSLALCNTGRSKSLCAPDGYTPKNMQKYF